MIITQENCYQGVDRSVLLELKKIYEGLLQKKEQMLFGEVESDTYDKLKELFTTYIYKPFFQGDNRYTVENELAKDFFIKTVDAVIKFLTLNISTNDIEACNLHFRLGRIIEKENHKDVSELGNEQSMMEGIPLELDKTEGLASPKIKATDIARSAFNITKQLPGKFAESMKNMLDVCNKMIVRNDRESRYYK